MSLIDIDGALIQAYQDMNLDLPTGFEGMHFDPPTNSHYAMAFIVPAGSDPATLGVSGTDRHTGFMQIDFYADLRDGRATLVGYAQAVRDQYVAGKWFTRNGQNVRVVRVDRTGIRQDDGKLRLTVTVFFEADTTRPEI